MATEGKQFRFSLKTILSIGGFVVAWIATKLMDTYLNMTLLADAKSWLLGVLTGVKDWLAQEQPQPNWFPVGLVFVILLLACVSIYIFRLYSSTLEELNVELSSKVSPTTPKLTTTQHLTLMRLASLLESGEMLGSITNMGIGTFFQSLENELALGQLEAMGYVEFTLSTSITPSRRKPVLTLKGMEYVSDRRKASAEKKQQKAKEAASAN